MKTITIREPYATLIKDKVKYIETRSWKTNYRGPLYIHSSKTKYKVDDKIKHLIKSELMYGKIMCEANLIDCIYMDEDFIKNEKENNYDNFICGRYEVGRYAWILSDIKVLEYPISVNGQLGLWNYKD